MPPKKKAGRRESDDMDRLQRYLDMGLSKRAALHAMLGGEVPGQARKKRKKRSK